MVKPRDDSTAPPAQQPTPPPANVSGHETILLITAELIRERAADARTRPRGRQILALHSSDDEPMHRMLNAVQPGSYIRPHRHVTPPKDEGIVLLAGAVGFVLFDDDGEPDRENLVHLSRDRGVLGVDFRAGLWHTMVALEPDSVIYEVKPGPWSAATDKDFAPWAPAEGTEESRVFLRRLEALFNNEP